MIKKINKKHEKKDGDKCKEDVKKEENKCKDHKKEENKCKCRDEENSDKIENSSEKAAE